MGQPLETHIRQLQQFYWSDADPDGRGFVPLADALRKSGDFMEAHRLLRDGLDRLPDFLAGHIVSAWLSLDRGEPEEAESRFREALRLDPRNIEALKGLAAVLVERGDDGSALAYLEALHQEDPADTDLPARILEIRDRVEASGVPQEVPSSHEPRGVWEDPSTVAEELDWVHASLQEDSTVGGIQEGVQEDPGGGQIVVEDGEPIPADGDASSAFLTPTLGEIYLRQGLLPQAESVFERLLAEDPTNDHLRDRLQEVRNLRASPLGGPSDHLEGFEAPTDAGAAVRARPEVEEEDAGRAPQDIDRSTVAPPPASVTLEVVPIESLAPDRRWPSEEPLSIDALAPEEPLSIDALAPEEPLSIDALAPEEPLSIDALAPEEPLSIDALAPEEPLSIDALAPEEPLSIDALAPEEPLSIDALAPEEPLSIDALAPEEPLSIDALAPEPDPPNVGEGGPDDSSSSADATIEAFERWLEDLE